MTTKGRNHSLTFVHFDLCPRTLRFNILKLLFLKNTLPFDAKFHMEPPWDFGMKICSNCPSHMTSPDPYMVQTSKNLLLWNKRLMTLKLGIQHRVLKYYHICSTDDTGLTLTIFMTLPNLFPNPSAWVTAYEHIVMYFQACSAYPKLLSMTSLKSWYNGHVKALLTFKCMTKHLFADFSYSIALDTYLWKQMMQMNRTNTHMI